MVSLTSRTKTPASSTPNAADSQVAQDLQKFLRFQLSHGVIGLLAAGTVTEIIQTPTDDVMPAPQMHPCVMGVFNWRSEMVWVVDLQYLLGYPPTDSAPGPMRKATSITMIVKQKERTLGLVVPLVEDLIELDMNRINPPSSELFSGKSFPFLEGYFMSDRREIMMLLKPDAIFSLA